MVLEVCQRHKHNHSLVLVSDNDCVGGDNNINTVPVSLFVVRSRQVAGKVAIGSIVSNSSKTLKQLLNSTSKQLV